jgi:hypothetical protein
LHGIEESAFLGSRLKSFVVPSSIEVLSKTCFDLCTSLESVVFEFDSKLI